MKPLRTAVDGFVSVYQWLFWRCVVCGSRVYGVERLCDHWLCREIHKRFETEKNSLLKRQKKY